MGTRVQRIMSNIEETRKMAEYKDKWCQEAYDRGFKEGRDFEKGQLTKAKEYAVNNYEMCSYYDKPYASDRRAREQGFKDDAEFGYNKANKWHYVKDGDLPKDEKDLLMSNQLNLLIKMKGSDALSLALGQYNFSTQEFCYQHIVGLTEVIAWKEIVLPELFEVSGVEK